MIGYHFVGNTLRDGRPVPPDGVWLEHKGPVEPCVSGLHASEHPFDALKYAPGSTLCLVELEGDLKSDGYPIDKWVGRRRKIIRRIDAEALLRRFACDQALSVAHRWEMPAVVHEYLVTADPEKRHEAREAARRFTENSAAARSAYNAALESPLDAASEAAASRAAVWAPYWKPAWEESRDEFARRVEAAGLLV